MPAPSLQHVEDAARACLQAITSPSAAQALAGVLERWNGLTATQQRRIYSLTEQLHKATAIRIAGRALHGDGR